MFASLLFGRKGREGREHAVKLSSAVLLTFFILLLKIALHLGTEGQKDRGQKDSDTGGQRDRGFEAKRTQNRIE